MTATSGSYQITHTGGTIFDIYSGGSLISNPGKRYYPSSCFMFKKIRHNKVYLGPTVSVNTSATMKIYNNMPSGYPSYYHMYFDIRGGNDRSTSADTVTFMSSRSSNIEVPRTQTVTIPHTKPTTSANNITFIEVHVEGYWDAAGYYSFALHVTDSNGVIIATDAFGSINNFSSQTFIPINSACTIGNVLLTVNQE